MVMQSKKIQLHEFTVIICKEIWKKKKITTEKSAWEIAEKKRMELPATWECLQQISTERSWVHLCLEAKNIYHNYTCCYLSIL